MFANVTQTEMLENIATEVSTQGQDFLNWSTGIRFSYALTPLWSLSATYRYQHNDSDAPNGSVNGSVNTTGLGGNYSENRVIFSLTAVFPVF
jgi:opacity protein-like surface antigen